MKIIVTANHVPFMGGGAQYHIDNLVAQLRSRGHEVARVRFPFDAASPAALRALMEHCEQSDFQQLNGICVDKVISLQYPGYGVQHPDHSVWVMHQHRTAYELYQPDTASPAEQALKARITEYDNCVLSRPRQLFANSARVAQRLQEYNGLVAEPLYHPPDGAERFFCADSQGYIFFPSRLENLKRQTLLIEAARHLRTPAKILLGGSGPQAARYQQLIEQYQLQDRVCLLGRFTEAEKLTYYAHALGVFFGPYDEDYGYITLEAMLSAKPVITCNDSGGPLEFVQQGENGFVVAPEPEQIAEKIDWLYQNPQRAAQMGRVGQRSYQQHNISWDNVISRLLAD